MKHGQISQIAIVRFVDRDMLMRYHWGLGIGHKYSWDSGSQAEDSEYPQPQPQPQPVSGLSSSENRMSQEEMPGSDHPENESMQLQEDVDDDPELHEDKNTPEEDILRDGMEDNENEDLGDDSDDLWTPGGEDDDDDDDD